MGGGDDACWNGKFALLNKGLLTSRESWLWRTRSLPRRTSLGLRSLWQMRMRFLRLCSSLRCSPCLCWSSSLLSSLGVLEARLLGRGTRTSPVPRGDLVTAGGSRHRRLVSCYQEWSVGFGQRSFFNLCARGEVPAELTPGLLLASAMASSFSPAKWRG